MALVLKDRVLELSTTVGTGTLTLDGAVNDFQTFSSAIGNGNTTYYTIVDDNASQWEIGLGTVGAGTLARNTVYASTNSNNLVNFAGNPKQVFCDYPANKSVYLDASGNVSSLGTITSGVWNGSTIPVANGGTGASTATDGLNNLLPSQTGNNGKVLATDGTNATWTTNGSGDVVGPASATDNAVARFDTTTGKLIQNSVTLIDDTGNASGILSQQFSNGSAVTLAAGKLWYDGSTGAWNAGMGNGNITQQIGEELFIYGKASAAITDSPLQIVYHTGTVGASGVITFAPTIAGITDENAIVGVATENIALNGFGRVTTFGLVRGITTNGTAFGETWADDDVIWYNPVTGNPTKVKPSAPNIKFQIGLVVKAGAGGSGSFQVALVQGTALGGTDSNVKLTSTTNGNILTYDGGNGYWKNTDLTAGTGISVDKSANGVLTVTNSSPNTYNPAAVAITGGTINGTTIGATTPAAGTFTTITGQTEVLKGTGNNSVLYSQDYTNAAWTKTAVTATASGATAPDSTSTAITILETTANSSHNFAPTTALTTSSGVLYTISVYVKANGRNYCALYEGISNKGKYFNITAGGGGSVLGNLIAAPVSAALTYIGSDWYRISIVVTAGGTIVPSVYLSTDGTTFSYVGNASLGIYAWGAQLEIGSTLNTYIPTTTTAIYGTPTLSFSGVAGLGLESNGALYVSPAGTGALQAQATTSSTVGGNARGANAVDWQTARGSASQVANGQYSSLNGGVNNTAGGQYAFVGSGFNNYNSGYASNILGGYNNSIASGTLSVITGGKNNTASGIYGIVNGGFTNSSTANAAVTTQSGTMNGTTAVTLSGSNASIKVGQYITGTSIAADTYVAAISGTSLTLSQNASGSSTSTLSFYTPHGVVVGGGNNQATGSYSFIGGGGDAGTAANRNTASGDWSVVCGGYANIASGLGAFIGGGGVYNAGQNFGNTASGQSSVIGGGAYNTATASYGSVLGGLRNNATGQYSSVFNGFGGTSRGIQGNAVFVGAYNSVTGDNQAAVLVLTKQTTDATASALTWGGGAAGSTNQVILPNNSAYYFKVSVIANVTGGGNTKAWTLEGAIKRGSGVGTTAIVGTVTTTVVATDAGAATWAVTATADTTNGGLAITVTGQASTTIRWVAKADTTEVTF